MNDTDLFISVSRHSDLRVSLGAVLRDAGASTPERQLRGNQPYRTAEATPAGRFVVRKLTTSCRRVNPDARIIALTSYNGEANIYMALELGVTGYLFKDTLGRDVVDAVRAAASGKRVIPPEVATRLAEYTPRVDLTGRELEVLRLAARGLRNREIAREIGRTPETVKIHLRHVMEKLHARDRTEAVVQAFRRGIIDIE